MSDYSGIVFYCQDCKTYFPCNFPEHLDNFVKRLPPAPTSTPGEQVEIHETWYRCKKCSKYFPPNVSHLCTTPEEHKHEFITEKKDGSSISRCICGHEQGFNFLPTHLAP